MPRKKIILSMRINITARDCLNVILSNKYPEETFIPFREAMIEGEYHFPPFSDSFLLERAKTHQSTIEEYKEHMKDFISFLSHIDDYDEIVMWFGNEPFCLANIDMVIKTLKDRNYTKRILLNTVIEETVEDIISIQRKIKTLLRIGY